MATDTERLRNEIAQKTAVIVVGTGASAALSGAAECANWIGLLRNGLAKVFALDPDEENAMTLQGMLLDEAVDRGNTNDIVGVASVVSQRLKAGSAQRYADWLRETVGELKVTDDRLAKAIGALNVPILTTNYDTLIETALGVDGVSWDDAESMRDVFKHEVPKILHLHGIWNRPDTVILSSEDYGRLLANPPSQFVQQSHYATKAFVYIGYGSGLSDPNFGHMLDEHRKLFPSSRGTHYRLCAEADALHLSAAHADDDIRVISYGADYSCLPGFLEEIANSLKLEVVALRDGVAFAREAVIENIRSNVLLTLGDLDTRDIQELTVAPVLLPVPHSRFAAAREAVGENIKPGRIDPDSVASERKILIVAGDELSGVSTAIQLLLASFTNQLGAAPIYVDARVCTSMPRPLKQEVMVQAIRSRIVDRRGDLLPDHVLAIDDVKPREGRLFDALIGEIFESRAEAIIIGCREGDESAIAARFAGHRLETETVFVGRFGKQEVIALAGLVSSARSEEVATRVLDIIRKQRLQRTPLNICLLISLAFDGEALGDAVSDTAILDHYVRHVIGWNGPYIDARMTLNPQNREAALSELAKHMTTRQEGALPYNEALKCMEEFFEEVGWSESARDTLDSFIVMRVLKVTDQDRVTFRQTSYLHLFAAKAANGDSELHDRIMEDPVYYSPIVRHYAALLRNSTKTLERMLELLDEWSIVNPESTVFLPFLATVAPKELGPYPNDDDDDDEGSDAEVEVAPLAYDDSPDDDVVPFPLEDQKMLPEWLQKTNLIDLVSRVLRDSDQVRDSELKDEILERVLRFWGHLLDSFAVEEIFDEAANIVASRLSEGDEESGRKEEHLAAQLRLLVPTYIVVAGINVCLSSNKLLTNLRRVSKKEEVVSDPLASTMAMILSFSLAADGWTSLLPDLLKNHGDRWIVGILIRAFAENAYLGQHLETKDEVELLRFLRETTDRKHSFSSDEVRLRELSNYEQKMERERLLNTHKRLGDGSSTVSLISPEGRGEEEEEEEEAVLV